MVAFLQRTHRVRIARRQVIGLVFAATLLSGCAASQSPQDEDPPIVQAKPTVSVSSKDMKPVAAPKPEKFSVWLKGVRKQALNEGIHSSTLDAAFKNVRRIRRVIELDRNQPEFKLTYDQYMNRAVPLSRIHKARIKYRQNKVLLDRISKKYGVQPQFLVAFWGVETDFGRTTGSFPIVSSLATLAHDGRRSEFFRKQLMYALHILDEGHVRPEQFKGSWAGAMGQCQFMPSTFVNYAVDGDGDGRIDLWHNKEDVFASAAHFLSQSGWNAHGNWGRPVKLPKKFDRRLANGERYSLRTWAALGVMDPNGRPVPDLKKKAALVFPEKKGEAAFLVYDNFYTTLKWNRSTFYALAVGQLADAIVNG